MSEPTLQQLTRQVQRLAQRVSFLEQQLKVPAAETTKLPDADAPVPSEPQIVDEQKPARDLEASVGLRLVNRVGAVTLILGIAFFFRYAVQNNWIGESARVLLGAGAGLALLLGGEWAFRRDQRVFAQGITGAGAAALYLSTFAAFSAYHLVPPAAAFFLAAMATLLSGYLAARYQAQAIAVLALAGGLLAPAMLDGKSLGEWFVPGYVAALDVGFVYLAARRRWSITEWLALTGTFLFTIFFADLPLHVFVPVYYLVFATRPNRPLFVAAHTLLLCRVTSTARHAWVYPPELIAMSLGGLAVVRWRQWYSLTSFLVVAAGVSWLAAGELMGVSGSIPLAGAVATLTILFAMFLVAVAWRTLATAGSVTTSEVVSLPVAAAFYFGACYQRLAGWGDSRAALLALLLACVYFALAYRLRKLPLPNPAGVASATASATVSAAVGTAFFTLAIPIQFHAFRITVAWALEGAALVWIAAKRGVLPAQAFGLFVLLCAAARFLVLDLFMYGSPDNHTLLLNARFATALALAISFFLAAVWSRGTNLPTWAPGVAGHLVLLTGLSFEVSEWVMRFHTPNQTSMESAALSILFAAYAVLLVALGTAQRSAGSRYMGLGLIALVVLKLYVYDVWQLDLVYRFIAFAALGALLLTMSFVYSRFRSSVASWLKKDEVSTPRGASAIHPPQQPE